MSVFFFNSPCSLSGIQPRFGSLSSPTRNQTLPQTLWITAGLTQSHGVTAEARSGHNDLIQGFFVSQHLEDLPGKAEQIRDVTHCGIVPRRRGQPNSSREQSTHSISVGRAAVQGSVQDTEFPDCCHLIHGL